MVQVKVKKRINRTTIVHKLDKNEQINAMELDIIFKGEIEALEPALIKTSFSGTKMKFFITDYIDIPSYLRSGVTFGEFTKLVEDIIGVVMACRSYGIRVSNLEMRPEYIYYNYTLKKLKMIYWPIISLSEYADEKDLFQQLSSYYICKPEDELYKNNYVSYFNSRKKFDIHHFEKTINTLSKRWVDQIMNQSAIDIDIASQHSEIPDDIYGMTVALNCPVLLRVSTNTRVEIKKSPFAIGRSANACDFVIEDNCYIGRKHAIIQQEGHQTYIIDNNSTNGTKIDGVPINPNQKVPLSSGKVIEIGHEEFIFFAQAGR